MTEVINTEIFGCNGVSAFTIPPGSLSITQWNNFDGNYVWKGSLKLIERESFEEDSVPRLPVDRICLKLELYNGEKDVWAVAWYNPLNDLGGGDDEETKQVETITRTESARLFKVIVQIPGTEYGGSKKQQGHQVAFGLKFDDKIDAYVFLERLESYKKQFASYVEQYNYEIENNIGMDKLSIGDEAEKHDDDGDANGNDDDDDNEFGDFIS